MYSLGTRWPPDLVRKPPHMSQEDYGLWKRWYPTVRAGVLALYFDVGLGEGVPLPQLQDEPENYKRMWIRNTQRRADALLVRSGLIWLVELRYLASPNAVGRLLTYLHLWRQDPPLPGAIDLHLVTNHHDADLIYLTEQFNIKLHEV